MAIFTKNNAAQNVVVGTASADIVLVPFGPHADDGAIFAGAGIDELRFSNGDPDLLIVGDNVSGIERVVIGTGTGATAVSTGTTALDVDASEALNALTIIGNAGVNLIFGTLFSDTITGGLGADELYGGAGNDVFLVASAASHPLGELIDGEGGVDTLLFTSAIAGETLVMRADDDVEAIVIGTAGGLTTGTTALHVDASAMGNFTGTRITGNAGNNLLIGTDGADSLAGGAGLDTLVGGDGRDTLLGGLGADRLAGGAGDDLLAGTAAELTGDSIDGGAGIDMLRIDGAAAGATVALGVLAGIEQVTFGAALAGAAVGLNATAAAGGLHITGTAGANTITGTAFDDTLLGGGGNDVFVIATAAHHGEQEAIVGGDGADAIRFTGAGMLVLSSSTTVEQVVVASGGASGIDGRGAAEMRLVGGAGANTLLGGLGNDVLVGGAGADSLDGGLGNDLYLYTSAAESALGEVINDTGGDAADAIEFAGSSGVLVLRAGTTGVEKVRLAGAAATGVDASLLAGNLEMTGNAGANSLVGGAGADTLHGGLGRDTLVGGAGDDRFTGDAAALTGDVIQGGDGHDVVVATGTLQVQASAMSGIEEMRGRHVSAASSATGVALTGDAVLASTLLGGLGSDTLLGGLGADRLAGGAGDDVILVDKQARLAGDTVDGGAGQDELLFTPAEDSLSGVADYLASLGLAFGPALLVGVGGMALSGVEKIHIAGEGGTVIADGSLQGTIETGGGSQPVTLEQISDPVFINALLVADQLDYLIFQIQQTLDPMFPGNENRPAQLQALMELVNLYPMTALQGFNLYVDYQALPEVVEFGTYNPAAVTSGLRIEGNEGSNLIAGTRFADTLVGDAGNDIFLVSQGSHHPVGEAIQGGTGNDEIWFSTGLDGDTLVLGFGDTGVESVWVRNLDGTVQAAAGVDASRYGASLGLYGNDASNVLVGSRFGDLLFGVFGDDVLQGGRGNDTMDGGAGSDVLQGGLGDDLFLNAHADPLEVDRLNGGAGMDTLRLDDGSTFDMTVLGRRSFASIERVEFGVMSSANSLLVSYDRVLESVGNEGVLTVTGDVDDTVLLQGSWTGTEAEGGFVDWMFEGANDTAVTVRVTQGVEVGGLFLGTAGTDSLVGGATNDRFIFAAGELGSGDTILGGLGNDTLQLRGAGTSWDLGVASLTGVERLELVDGGSLRIGSNGFVEVRGSLQDDSLFLTASSLPLQVTDGDGYDYVEIDLDGPATVNGNRFFGIEDVRFASGGSFTLGGSWAASLSVVESDSPVDYEVTLDGAEFFSLALGTGDDVIVAGTFLGFGSGIVLGADGNDTLQGAPLGNYLVDLGAGNDVYLFDAASSGREVWGGEGADTIVYADSLDGSVTVGSSGFETLDAGEATGSLVVMSNYYEGGSLSITTGAGNDRFQLDSDGGAVKVIDAGAGADTMSGVGAGDQAWLEEGSDTFSLDVYDFLSSGGATWTVNGGAGSDTLKLTDAFGTHPVPVTIDLSSGLITAAGGQILNFENFDGAESLSFDFVSQFGYAPQHFTVTAAATGSVISTSTLRDHVYLGAGVDIVRTDAPGESGSDDTVTGALSAGDHVVMGTGDDLFQLTGPVGAEAFVDAGGGVLIGNPADTLAIMAGTGDLFLDLSETSQVFQGFGRLEGREATGNLTVLAGPYFTVVNLGAGNDVLTFESVNSSGIAASLGAGNDRANLIKAEDGLNVDGQDGVDTVFATGAGNWTIDLNGPSNLSDPRYYNFENFDGSQSSGNLIVVARTTGSEIVTGTGNDNLYGADGNDTLTGGSGADLFRINAIPGSSVDTISDFVAGVDVLVLNGLAFSAAPSNDGLVSADNLALGTEAADGDDFLVYDQVSGNLYYDADADGAGAAVLFAVFSNQVALTADDIVLT